MDYRRDSPLILEYIEIHRFYSPGVAAGFFSPLPLFGGVVLPSLRHLRLDGVNIHWEVGVLSRLTTLDLRRIAVELLPSSADFRAVLSGADGLEKLVLDAAGPKYERDVLHTFPPVTVASLRILVLGNLADYYAEYFLSHFIAPNVLHLTIMHPMHYIYTKLLTSLSSTSRMPKVKILNLNKLPMVGLPIPNESQSLLARWFESMPELTFIRLSQTSHQIWEVLSSGQSPGTIDDSEGGVRPNLLCPQLSYVDYQSDLNNFDNFTAWIGHRRRMGYPLRKVWVTPDIARGLGGVQKARLLDALGGLGVAQPSGMSTMEEEAMCKPV